MAALLFPHWQQLKKIKAVPRKRKWKDLVPPKDREANPLYITEHMNAQQMSDADLGKAFRVSRQTAFRWRTEQERLSVTEMAAIAKVLKTNLAGLLFPPKESEVEEISLDAAARHIRNREERERLAKFIEGMRGSDQ